VPTPHLDTYLTAAMPGEQVRQHTNKQFPYVETLGALRYLADSTRPDIPYAVRFLGRYSHKPTKRHWRALLRVIQCIAGTSEHGLMYGPETDDLEKLSAHSDSDWAGDKDGRKSTTGNVIMYGGGPMSWKSTTQKSVALSSCEAELVAMTETTKRIIWFRKILTDLDQSHLEAVRIQHDAENPTFAENSHRLLRPSTIKVPRRLQNQQALQSGQMFKKKYRTKASF
jgi:hypothetical protein